MVLLINYLGVIAHQDVAYVQLGVEGHPFAFPLRRYFEK